MPGDKHTPYYTLDHANKLGDTRDLRRRVSWLQQARQLRTGRDTDNGFRRDQIAPKKP